MYLLTLSETKLANNKCEPHILRPLTIVGDELSELWKYSLYKFWNDQSCSSFHFYRKFIRGCVLYLCWQINFLLYIHLASSIWVQSLIIIGVETVQTCQSVYREAAALFSVWLNCLNTQQDLRSPNWCILSQQITRHLLRLPQTCSLNKTEVMGWGLTWGKTREKQCCEFHHINSATFWKFVISTILHSINMELPDPV